MREHLGWAALLAWVVATAGACGGARPAEPPPTAPVAQPTAPFASVVALEPVQLTEPMLFRRSGRTVEARHVVVVYLRPTYVERFLPRGIETPFVFLEDSPAIPLYPPLRPIWAVVAPRPAILLREASLWVAPIGKRVTEQQRDSLVALRRTSQRRKPGDVISLSRVPAAAVRSTPTILRDRSALLAHVLARADSLTSRAR